VVAQCYLAVLSKGGLDELNAKWRAEGIAHPFQARIGINSGSCNVDSFLLAGLDLLTIFALN
jgi:hypothetical protein